MLFVSLSVRNFFVTDIFGVGWRRVMKFILVNFEAEVSPQGPKVKNLGNAHLVDRGVTNWPVTTLRLVMQLRWIGMWGYTFGIWGMNQAVWGSEATGNTTCVSPNFAQLLMLAAMCVKLLCMYYWTQALLFSCCCCFWLAWCCGAGELTKILCHAERELFSTEPSIARGSPKTNCTP